MKPFRRISIYFSIYAILSFFLLVGLVFRGILGAIIISIILFPIIPKDRKYENNDFIISTPFQGFLAPCCTYQLDEKIFFIFENNYGTFDTEGPINFETINIELKEQGIELTFNTDFDENLNDQHKIKISKNCN
ncbi:MAG: hypothetical protein ACQETL_04875 [Bacteroidota bacterium]